MSRTFRRVNKYVSYCTLDKVKEDNNRRDVKIMDLNSCDSEVHRKWVERYISLYEYDEKLAVKHYRDGFKTKFSCEYRSNVIYKRKERAYYKSALRKSLKSDDKECCMENIRKYLGGIADWSN